MLTNLRFRPNRVNKLRFNSFIRTSAAFTIIKSSTHFKLLARIWWPVGFQILNKLEGEF